jgi:NitT/TauT family transport system permease protein
VIERRRARLLAPVVTFVVAMLGWSLTSLLLLDPSRRFLLPPPHRVLAEGVLNGEHLGEIIRALGSTTEVALMGLALSMLIGVSLGIVMNQARWLEYSIYPYAVVLQTIPILAMVPLLGFWFGFDRPSRVIVCVLVSLFPMITNTLLGLKSIDDSQRDLFRLYRASRWQRLRYLELPAALPSIITGFKISGGLAVIGAIVADFFFRQGEPGIGRLIDIYRQRLATEQLMTSLFMSSLLGLLLFFVFDAIERRVARGRSARTRAA